MGSRTWQGFGHAHRGRNCQYQGPLALPRQFDQCTDPAVPRIAYAAPMNTNISPLAGQPAQAMQLVDVTKLVFAYYNLQPDPTVPAQRVSFGTSGHRGTSFDKSFNEAHVLAITQAICLYRNGHGSDGPLFIGIDTH